MVRNSFLFSIFLALACPARAQSSDQLKTLYDAHQWFQLRAAVGTDASAFYRGVVAFAFDDRAQAEKNLEAQIASAPNSDETYQAREFLTYLYIRAGRYRRAFEQSKAMLTARPNNADARNAGSLFAALGRYPDQSVIQRRASVVRYRMDDGNLFVPVSVNGKPATYMLDSGANLSTMSESESKRLGLVVDSVDFKGQDATGGDVAFRVAVVDQLSVGEMKLANVAFLIVGDDQQPFVDSPAGERGIIGLPVLLAFETVRWSRDGNFELGFPPGPKDIGKSNLCFDGADIITKAALQDRALNLLVDTGASHTWLWPPFGKDFASLVAGSGKKGVTPVEGVGHKTESDSMALPELKLRVGGFNVVLRPAPVLLKETTEKSHWFHGNLGLDLLNQANAVTFDFPAMSLSLR
jgi:predicted aspartyl protease